MIKRTAGQVYEEFTSTNSMYAVDGPMTGIIKEFKKLARQGYADFGYIAFKLDLLKKLPTWDIDVAMNRVGQSELPLEQRVRFRGCMAEAKDALLSFIRECEPAVINQKVPDVDYLIMLRDTYARIMRMEI